VACRSEVVTDEGAFHKFISIAALHRATEHLACPLTFSPRQAAALAAVVEQSILGSNPIIHVQRNYTLTNSSSLVWYALLGLLAAIVSVAFTESLLGLRARFRRLTGVPRGVHPAIGGRSHRRHGGCCAGALPPERHRWRPVQNPHPGAHRQNDGDRYGRLLCPQACFHCQFVLHRRLGGIFAPALFMGGMMGGAVGCLDVIVFHHSADSIGAFAVVGMGAVFAGIVRVPMTSVLIII
jgi:chloride channel protein, CIC family